MVAQCEIKVWDSVVPRRGQSDGLWECVKVYPEHCALLLCIELHLVWVVLLLARLVSTKIVRHPCEVEVFGAVFPQRR